MIRDVNCLYGRHLIGAILLGGLFLPGAPGLADECYDFHSAGGAWIAANRGVSAEVDVRGLALRQGGHSWSLALEGWGEARTPERIAPNRVELQREHITEWLVNGPRGLEHGWTVFERPTDGDDLTLAFNQGGSLRAVVGSDGRGLQLAEAGAARMTYGGLTAWDAGGKALAARFAVDGERVLVRVADDGARYPVTVDPWVDETNQAGLVYTRDRQTTDLVGYSIALSTDQVVLAVGAYAANPVDRNSAGAIYIFADPSKRWRLAARTNYAAKIYPYDGTNSDYFSMGMAMSADGHVIAGGAYGVKINGTNDCGAVYIFTNNTFWSGTNTNYVAKLQAAEPKASNYFGKAVAMAPDARVIAVGAYAYDSPVANNAGAVYVYTNADTAWSGTRTNDALLYARDAVAGDSLGYSVAMNSNGSVIVVGAYQADGVVSNAGCVYVFTNNPGAWTGTITNYAAKIYARDGTNSDEFGVSVAISPDGTHIVVGAENVDVAGTSSVGAVYVYTNASATWSGIISNYAARFVPSTIPYMGSDFGHAVAISPDSGLIVVGAKTYRSGGMSSAGAVLVYTNRAGSWAGVSNESALLYGTNSSCSGSQLGASVLISPDKTLVAGGAPYFDAGNTNDAGAVLWFQLAPMMLVLGTNSAPVASGSVPSTAKGTDFGTNLCGVTLTNTLYITNSETVALRITGVTTNGAGAGTFRVRFLPTVVAPGTVSNFSIIFAPGIQYGTHTASVTLANDSPYRPYNINVRGVALPLATIWLAPSNVSFSMTYGGTLPAPQAVSLTNVGFTAYGYTNLLRYGTGASGWLANNISTGWLAAKAVTEMALTADGTGLDAGTYYATNTVISAEAVNSPQDVRVTLTVAKADQAITFDALGTQTVSSVVNLGATAGSGLPVSFAVASGPGGIGAGGTTLIFSATGQVAVVASQAGDGNWNAAPNVTNLVTVVKAGQAITFAAIGTQTVSSVVNLSATASSGLPVSFAAVSGPGSIASGTTLVFSTTGQVAVVASQAGDGSWNAASNVTNLATVIGGGTTSSLAAPTGLTASDGTYTDKVAVAWNSVSGALDYDLWRNTTNDSGTATLLQAGTATTCDDTNASAVQTYYYWVRARNATETSAFSAPETGYRANATNSGLADLAATRFLWEPGSLTNLQHPTLAILQMVNNGPDSLSGSEVAVDIYLGTNSAFDGGGRQWIGDYRATLTLAAGEAATLSCEDASLAGITIPATADGAYYVFGRVRHLTTLTDTNMLNNSSPRSQTIRVGGTAEPAKRALIGDFDGDRKYDPGVVEEGTWDWQVALSGIGYGRAGLSGYGEVGCLPACGDYDGDRKADPALYQESTGLWMVKLSGMNYADASTTLGGVGYEQVTGDFDGGGRSDLGVYQEANGMWQVLPPELMTILTLQYGAVGYKAVTGDYDGDRKTDLGLYHCDTGAWYVKLSGSGYNIAVLNGFGGSGYSPIMGDFDGDGKADPALYQADRGAWFVKLSGSGYGMALLRGYGTALQEVISGDYDGDGKTDLVLYDSSSATWYFRLSAYGYQQYSMSF